MQSKKDFCIVMAVIAAMIAVLVWMNIWEAQANAVKPDRVFPMCNQRIEWTYARSKG